MSDELFKALVVIGVFLLPLFIMIATDSLGDHDPEPNCIQTLKGFITLIPIIGLIFGIGSLIEA
jgi:ABC-type proline/glycine betaine transport system permease subunit